MPKNGTVSRNQQAARILFARTRLHHAMNETPSSSSSSSSSLFQYGSTSMKLLVNYLKLMLNVNLFGFLIAVFRRLLDRRSIFTVIAAKRAEQCLGPMIWLSWMAYGGCG